MSVATIERYLLSNELGELITKKMHASESIERIITDIYDNTRNVDISDIQALRAFPILVPRSDLKKLYELLSITDPRKQLSVDELQYYEDVSFLLSSRSLKLLEQILLSTGCFFEANVVFQTLVKKVLIKSNKKHHPKSFERDLLWALIYSESFRSNIAKNKISNPYIFKKNRDDFDSLMRCFDCSSKNLYDGEDNIFTELISGKNILVIGPAPIDIDYETIKNYDCYVVINYKGTEKYSGFISTYSPIISYYNYEAEEKISQGDFNCFDQLDYICFRQPRFNYQYAEIKNGRARVYTTLDGMQLFGQPYILQNILFDLLRYNPKSIKLMCFSLYATSVSYENGYINSSIVSRDRLFGFAKHNIINQFLYLKSLRDLHKIQFDDFGEKLIDAGLENYLKKMKQLYAS